MWVLVQTTWPLRYIQVEEGLGPTQGIHSATPTGSSPQCFSDPRSASKEITSHISTYYALSWQENVRSWRNSMVEERDRLGVSFESRGPPSCPIYQGS